MASLIEKERLRKLYLDNKEKYDKKNKEWRENNPKKFKIMQRKASKKYYDKNKEVLLEKNKIWCKNNPERLKELKKKANAKWYSKPGVKEKQAENQRKRNKFIRENFPEKIRKQVYDPNYYQRNKEHIHKLNKEWIKNNIEKHNAYKSEWNRDSTKKLTDTYLKILFKHRYGKENLEYFDDVKDNLREELKIKREIKLQKQ